MHSLLKSYNRRYYRRVVFIHIRAWWKIARLYLATYIIKFAFKVSPDAKEAIESKLKPRNEW